MTRDDPDARAEAFWQGYLETLPVTERGRRYYEAFQFGRGREMVTQLTRLVLDGVKTATSDLLWQLEVQHKPLWAPGDEHVVFDAFWMPVCVIRTKELLIKPFNEVDEAFAYDYGEGDRTLEWWRRHEWNWYAAECHEIGREPAEDMPLLCERFEVVYVPSRVTLI